jgi:hypothetical protein
MIAASIITIVIHTQVSGVCAILAAAVEFSELKNNGVKIINGNESKIRQQTTTNAGSMIRHMPLSRKFSVFAVPYASLCSMAGFSNVAFWLDVVLSMIVLLKKIALDAHYKYPGVVLSISQKTISYSKSMFRNINCWA